MNLRVAVIGAGHWHAPRYIDVLLGAGAQIAGVSDVDPRAAHRVAEAVGCSAYPAHTDLLTDSRSDVVFALPRHEEAADVALTLLDSGLPFAIEKPLGVSAGQVDSVATRARSTGVYAAVALVNRYRPIWSVLHRYLADPGTAARHAHFRIINGPASRYVDAGCDWMLDPVLAGGGALRNLGIHAADAALTLGGGDPKAFKIVGASLGFSQPDARVEDYAMVLLSGPGGLSVTIEVGYTFPTPGAGMTGSGDSEWRVSADGLYLVERDDLLTVVDSDKRHQQRSEFDGYQSFVLDVLQQFRSERDPIATIEDCRRAMVLVDAMYRAAGAPWLDAVGDPLGDQVGLPAVGST